MEKTHLSRAAEYYTLVGEKNAEGIQKYLHPDVEFSGPLSTLKGREAVIEATSNFMSVFKSLAIRAKFASGDQAMIIYDVEIPWMEKSFPGASLMSFREGMIVKIELFFDGRPFAEKK